MAIDYDFSVHTDPADETLRRTQPPSWFWTAAIWCAIALFDATQTVWAMRAEGMHHAWPQLFLTLLLSWLPWALATPLVLRLGRQYSPLGWSARNWFIHLAACASVAMVYAAWTAWLETLMNPWATPSGPGNFLDLSFYKFYGGVLSSLILYSSILAAGYALDSRERLAGQQIETARLNDHLSK